MIAVAAYHPLQQAKMLVVDTRQAVLVYHEHSLTVADVEQGWRHRVVRRAVGIAAEFLQLPDTPFHERFRDGSTYTSMILMHIHALQFQRLTIQHEAFISIEGYVADTRCGLIDVRHLSSHFHCCLHLI